MASTIAATPAAHAERPGPWANGVSAPAVSIGVGRRIRSPRLVPMALARGHRSRRWGRQLVKRGLDVVLAVLALIVTLPVILVAALMIKWHDGGHVLFRHERVGKNGRRFVLYKLRTMVPHAERQLSSLRDRSERGGPLFKLADDPRVTRVGRFLRAASIDELPQLINVLKGDMSLVGPRPALPEEFAQFDEALRGRARVLPGITGLWQVEARDDPSFETYRRCDLFYLEHWSLLLDVVILVTTVRHVGCRSVRALRRHPVLSAEPAEALVLD